MTIRYNTVSGCEAGVYGCFGQITDNVVSANSIGVFECWGTLSDNDVRENQVGVDLFTGNVLRNTIADNSAVGIFLNVIQGLSDTLIAENLITGNGLQDSDGALGGITVLDPFFPDGTTVSILIQNNTIAGNHSRYWGGGVNIHLLGTASF